MKALLLPPHLVHLNPIVRYLIEDHRGIGSVATLMDDAEVCPPAYRRFLPRRVQPCEGNSVRRVTVDGLIGDAQLDAIALPLKRSKGVSEQLIDRSGRDD